MLVSLSSEINALSHQLERISEKNRTYRDFTLNTLTFAIREVMAALPVYRTYLSGGTGAGPGGNGQAPADEAHIRAATAEAKRRNPRTAASLFEFIEDTLLLRNLESFNEEDRPNVVAWVMKFQQVSGPVMAKGVEDTAFYQYMRLVSLNEVGGDPARFGLPVAEFHRRNMRRLRRRPHSMLATTTHDTKRSEDVRARINVLSEIPGEWREAVARWGRMNVSRKVRVEGVLAPDANDEYLLYQTLIGAWPIGRLTKSRLAEFRDRIVAYMLKAAKEAKVHTSWVNTNEGYEAALEQFVRSLIPDDPRDELVQDLAVFQERIARLGAYNTLSQTLLKLTSPGVPDLYQGTELWALSLVDPDNRRPVNFDERGRLLQDLRVALREHGEDRGELACSLLDSMGDGRAKLFVVHQVLECRRELADLFAYGDYVPIRARGPHRRQVCAFARVHEGTAVIAVAPRLLAGLTEGGHKLPLGTGAWADTELTIPGAIEADEYRDVLTGERIRARPDGSGSSMELGQVLVHFPVALLRAETRRRRRAA
jgi:(1->4)-alpha-D-glucan 1-alpha-D-glucosylmutase